MPGDHDLRRVAAGEHIRAAMAKERDNAPAIGPILQQHRRARRQTLDSLAKASGVSKSMLSQIERGRANPTFAVLWSLTRALGVEFGDLTSSQTAVSTDSIEAVTAAATPEMRSSDGKCRLRILSPPRLVGETEWYELEIAPGGVLSSAPHTAGAQEHLTVLAGSFAVTSGNATRTIGNGETARYPADVPHSIGNPTNKLTRGLLVVLYR